jgi:hypothetical protein
MSWKTLLRVVTALLSCLVMPLYATSSPAVVPGVTRHVDVEMPSTPISTQAQLDAYVRDTPASGAPLNWLTPSAKKRFLAGVVFGERGLGGLNLGDLPYELTREQAYDLLRLFGAQGYAMKLDARSTPRPADSGNPASDMERIYNQLEGLVDQRDPSPETVKQTYTQRVSPMQTDGRRRKLTDRDVEFLFRSATLAFKFKHQPVYLDDMRADFFELQRRHLVDRPHASDFYDALILAGKSGDARSLQRGYRLIERGDAPTMNDAGRIISGQASLWLVDDEHGKREFVRSPFHLRASAQVIVLASTGCHFAKLAARDIDADPTLREVFRESAQWVAPANELTQFDAIRTWNQHYPSNRLGVIRDNTELSMVKRIETPTFYFLDHGRFVDTVVGWPDGGNLDAIRHGLRTIKLLP